MPRLQADEKPAVAAAAPAKPAPVVPRKSLADVERFLRQRKMIDAAIEKIYIQRGGARFDAQLRLFDSVVALANSCRDDELKRVAQTGTTLREKGERPIVSMSESRLFCARQSAIMDRREELLAACRETVMTAVNSWQPTGEADLQAALDTCVGELSEQSREQLRKGDDDQVREQAEADSLIAEADALVMAIESAEDRAALMEAQRTNNEPAIVEVLRRQPREWLAKWVDVMRRMKT